MLRFEQSRRTLTITGFGWRGAVVVLAILIAPLALLRLLSAPFTPEEARNAVQHFLQWQILQGGTNELQARGIKLPDHDTAQRWKEQIDRAAGLKIVSVEIKRTVFHLFSLQPSYAIKVVFKDAEKTYPPRYFSTYRGIVTSESNEWVWWLSL